jgi:hypothetical protein
MAQQRVEVQATLALHACMHTVTYARIFGTMCYMYARFIVCRVRFRVMQVHALITTLRGIGRRFHLRSQFIVSFQILQTVVLLALSAYAAIDEGDNVLSYFTAIEARGLFVLSCACAIFRLKKTCLKAGSFSDCYLLGMSLS